MLTSFSKKGLIYVFSFFISFCYAVNPEKEYPYSPQQFGIAKYESLKIQTSDGYNLAAWHFTPEKLDRKILIVIACGDAVNKRKLLRSKCGREVYNKSAHFITSSPPSTLKKGGWDV